MSSWILSLAGLMVFVSGCGDQNICAAACESQVDCMIQADVMDDASSVDCSSECEQEDVEAMQDAFQCMDEAYANADCSTEEGFVAAVDAADECPGGK